MTSPNHPVLLVPVDIGVDSNRDGTIVLPSEQGQPQNLDSDGNPLPVDATSKDNPYRFWINNGQTTSNSGETVPVNDPNYTNDEIHYIRNLENFSRLWIKIGGLQDAISNGSIQVGLKWINVRGTGSPAINIYPAYENDGGTQYLSSETTADYQITGTNDVPVTDVNGKQTVDTSGTFIFPKEFWSGLSQSSPKEYLLFEGAGEGQGELELVFLDQNGNEIGQGPGVWMDLLDVKKMYVRGKGTPPTMAFPHDNIGSEPSNSTDWVPDPNENPFDTPPNEAKQAVIFVHGINPPGGGDPSKSYNTWVGAAETVFKRLWWQGYQGRFGLYFWPALTPANPFQFNDSEYRGWKYGKGLANFVNSFPSGYSKNLYSFSQGATVCGSALTVFGLTVDNYVISQGAVPAGCYDTSPAVNSYADFLNAEMSQPTPDTTSDLGYRGYLDSLNVTSSVISFYNTSDYALKTGNVFGLGANWEANQINFKPNSVIQSTPYVRSYVYDTGAPSPNPVGHRCFLRDLYEPYAERPVTDIQESMSFIARPRSEAVGAVSSVGGSVGGGCYYVGPGSDSNFGSASSDHGGQFSHPIQDVWQYYQELGTDLNVLNAQ